MSIYDRVRVNNPGHSFFNLSHDVKFDFDAGQLIPFLCKFVMPGDVFKYGNEIVSRMNPLVAPVMHEINQYTQYFFVPLRIMFGESGSQTVPTPYGNVEERYWTVFDHDFEIFLTGGRSGFDSRPLPHFFPYNPVTDNKRINNDNYVHPIEYDSSTGNFSNSVLIDTGDVATYGSHFQRGQLYYYYDGSEVKYFFTYETNLAWSDGPQADKDLWTPLYLNEVTSPVGLYSLWDYLGFPIGVSVTDNPPLAFPFRAYNLVWNNYFRDQNLMPEIDVAYNERVMNVCWNKDYFTSAYTELQRGQSPALPLSNSLLPVYFDRTVDGVLSGKNGQVVVFDDGNGNNPALGTVGFSGRLNLSSGQAAVSDYDSSSVAKVDASGLFNVNDLRTAFRVQEWLEVNLRVGTHLNEFLIGHFGVGPSDQTLQRPIYLGGSKSPVIVSEVLQTSSTDLTSPQGNMAGHGITADRNFIGTYHAKEFGVLLGVTYVRPKASYQQGIDRSWLYETKYDFPFPEFAHLGNQAIFTEEIFATNDSNLDANGNPIVFAYTERYNELRHCHSEVRGGLRSIFDFWHLGRIFDNSPLFNGDFVKCVPSKRIFAVQNEPGFTCTIGNLLHAYRPLPYFGDPRT